MDIFIASIMDQIQFTSTLYLKISSKSATNCGPQSKVTIAKRLVHSENDGSLGGPKFGLRITNLHVIDPVNYRQWLRIPLFMKSLL